jgi:hypothetical protein
LKKNIAKNLKGSKLYKLSLGKLSLSVSNKILHRLAIAGIALTTFGVVGVKVGKLTCFKYSTGLKPQIPKLPETPRAEPIHQTKPEMKN